MLKFFYCIVFFIWSISLEAKDSIRIVGSSTVYPFVAVVSEKFSDKTHLPAPIVEATGTGGGFKMFCASSSLYSPSIVNASRRILLSEQEFCAVNGVKHITEIKLGYDAIVLIHHKNLQNVNLSREQIFLALAKKIPDSNGNFINNPYKKWNEIDTKLPNIPIKIMGPPSTSGTRDSFISMVMTYSCDTLYAKGKFKKISNPKMKKEICTTIRTDGVWVNGGENDMLIVKKVSNDKDLFAILGYSFYIQNQKLISATMIENISPKKQNLQDRTYPLFRPLFVYVKNDNVAVVKGLKQFIKELTSPATMTEKGYLHSRGLIPLNVEEYKQMKANLSF